MRTNPPYSFSRMLLAYLASWLTGVILHSYVLFQFGLSCDLAGIDGSVSITLLSILSLVTTFIYRFYQPGRSNKIFRLIYCVTLAFIYVMALKFILPNIIVSDPTYTILLERSLVLRFVFALLVISFITLINWMLNAISEQKEKEKKQSDVDALLREAELSKLRQQLQPHFLFNSLNSINALIGTKPNEARQMVQQLSDFLRGTLKKDEQKVVPLKEEFEHLKLYLEIEKVRFGHRLKVETDIDEQCLPLFIPPLLLQPIVENAIKFGLYDTIDEITISISSKAEAGYLNLEVQNPFDASTQNANKGTGFGLASIKRRLYLLYARNDLMTTRKTENTFFTTLRIPQ